MKVTPFFTGVTMYRKYKLTYCLVRLILIVAFVLPAHAQTDFAAQSKNKVTAVFKKARLDSQRGDFITATAQDIPDLDSETLTTLPAQTRLNQFAGQQIRSAGKTYFVTLWNAESPDLESNVPGGGAAILAVFSPSQPEPLDILNVKADRSASLAETPIHLGKTDAFVIRNSHHNAGQAYLITAFFQVYRGKLQQIDSIFTLSNYGLCDSFTETLTWKTAKHAHAMYPAFTAQVTLLRQRENSDDESCRQKKVLKNRVFSKTYHWNPRQQRYEGSNKEFNHLQRFNAQNV